MRSWGPRPTELYRGSESSENDGVPSAASVAGDTIARLFSQNITPGYEAPLVAAIAGHHGARLPLSTQKAHMTSSTPYALRPAKKRFRAQMELDLSRASGRS